ncbi:hypothetical protein YSA_01373 [Pseudomonas putida ND6]|uniref:Uncharacterized protein n=1 Tax=Pseudomonas putida ND6 TaxID=231023 RepID=I3UPU3_PSEPU|nr:hypothetical protein YSA_01373 [Pseudomonas putida ND6]
MRPRHVAPPSRRTFAKGLGAASTPAGATNRAAPGSRLRYAADQPLDTGADLEANL